MSSSGIVEGRTMSAAAEYQADTNQPRRRKRKAKRATLNVDQYWRAARRVLLTVAVVVSLLIVAATTARALRPTKHAEPSPAPLVIASATETRTPSPIIPLQVDPSRPTPPVIIPRHDEKRGAIAPPVGPPKPELLSVRPRPDLAPAPKPDAPAAPKPAAPAVASTRKYTGPPEMEYLKQLSYLEEFGLPANSRQSMAASYQTDYQLAARSTVRPDGEPSTLLQWFPQAAQLPLRYAPTCQLNGNEAFTLGALAKKLHAYIDLVAPFDEKGLRKEPVKLREVLRKERHGKRPEWLRPEAVPALTQILMHEDTPLRLMLVELLSEIEGPNATIKLAQRAVFDTSNQVREEAIAALRDRPRELIRPVLIYALRYPWPPAAVHAAEALVALGDKDAAPLLAAQLGKPDPSEAYTTADGRLMIRDVVRINHIENCLLCHMPAFNGRDPVVGIDPITRRASTTVENPNTHYGKPIVTQNRPGIWANNLLIRADVQFLRQDFSVTFPLKPVFGTLQGRRVDFVVRTRQLKGEELRDWRKKEHTIASTYPQRESVLKALRALTGKDAGSDTEAWANLFPTARAEAEGMRITEALMKANRENADRVVAKIRDSKAEVTTEGLARAIPNIGGKMQARARETLAVRLSRLTAEEIRARLYDEDDEMRYAAALGCIRRGDRESIPDLIALLQDADAKVVDGARKVLQCLTDEDFGPEPGANAEKRAAAVSRWLAWHRLDAQP
jgi:HEAT repeat protein